MRIGISELGTSVGGRTGRWIADAATIIEEVGFDSMWFPMRVVSADAPPSTHPYGGDREVATLRRAGLYDPVVSATAAAMTTTRLRLGTFVDLVALRHPLITAGQIATLDQISGGRVLYGVGAGWYQPEFDLLNVPFDDRGERVSEYLRAIKQAWAEPVARHSSSHVEFRDAIGLIKPLQTPHPPILVGGNSAATIARIAEVGDGWVGYGLTPAEISTFVNRLTKHLDQAGRSLAEVTLKVGFLVPGASSDRSADELDVDAWRAAATFISACADLGLDEVILTARIPVDGYEENMARLADAVRT